LKVALFGDGAPEPTHVFGTARGEELVKRRGREHGRSDRNPRGYRDARDSTGLNAKQRRPIDPAMPEIPPA
jgi:acetyl-CoA carboxylase alpha subunit